ncbi:MAG: PilZ domain-containing protein [Proteobacteria bacterium]|nr:PilZ domain-containing protein [Pseudomonadota bacterium]
MAEKIYITSDNKAAIKCPSCGKTKVMDATKYTEMKTAVKGNIKCPCGHAFSFILERRKFYRKSTRLSGRYKVIAPPSRKTIGTMIVNDISKSGIQIKPAIQADLEKGDKLLLEFKLDDKHQTPISIEAVVMTSFSGSVGLRFCSNDVSDPNIKAIGFYLF